MEPYKFNPHDYDPNFFEDLSEKLKGGLPDPEYGNQYSQSGASMGVWQPSLREDIGNWVYDAAGAVGHPTPQHVRDTTLGMVDYTPGPGDAVAANETARALDSGRYADALLWAMGTVTYAPVGKAAASIKKRVNPILEARRERLHRGNPVLE